MKFRRSWVDEYRCLESVSAEKGYLYNRSTRDRVFQPPHSIPPHYPHTDAEHNRVTDGQRVCTWLTENGADPNAFDEEGETPMHAAVNAGHASVAIALERRGGNLEMGRRRDGKTPSELAAEKGQLGQLLRDEFDETRTVLVSTDVTVAQLLPAPPKLFGFTYVSLFLETLSLPSTVEVGSPAVTLSVFSAKGQLVEATQDVISPTLAFPDYLWWGQTWHMRTPLETLGTGSTVVFELRDLQGAEKKTLCWGALPLDRDFLNTQPELLCTFLPPTDPASLHRSEPTTGCYGVGNPGTLPPLAESMLAADVLLTRALR